MKIPLRAASPGVARLYTARKSPTPAARVDTRIDHRKLSSWDRPPRPVMLAAAPGIR